MDESSKAGAELLKSFSSRVMKEMSEQVSPSFAREMTDLAVDNVFSRLWLRPGLDRRARSLVTLGILIALGAMEEFKVHSIIAMTNGLSLAELEEVIYHASGYAGFPAANAARAAATEALRKEGLID